ncbi:hypothetical protein P3T23_002038 [Paraburkholderia sp. GAS448]
MHALVFYGPLKGRLADHKIRIFHGARSDFPLTSMCVAGYSPMLPEHGACEFPLMPRARQLDVIVASSGLLPNQNRGGPASLIMETEP